MITYLFPTHDRPSQVRQTLEALAKLTAEAHEQHGGAQVIIIDNASPIPVKTPQTLDNGFAVQVIRLDRNIGAAARNVGVDAADGQWIVMLDDDSAPIHDGLCEVLIDIEPDIAAVGASVRLPSGRHEAGGLPEVIIGCGAAIRRDAFQAVGGYDETFDYYVEEYDLCAKLLLRGWRIVHDLRFEVIHHKVADRRDMNVILERLVRNNAWVMQRYAPPALRAQLVKHTIERYQRIAAKENALSGFDRGLQAVERTLAQQPDTPMSKETFDRFTGLFHVRSQIAAQAASLQRETVAIIDRGKNVELIESALSEAGVDVVEERVATLLLAGSLSPGPMLGTWEQRQSEALRVMLPWEPRGLVPV